MLSLEKLSSDGAVGTPMVVWFCDEEGGGWGEL